MDAFRQSIALGDLALAAFHGGGVGIFGPFRRSAGITIDGNEYSSSRLNYVNRYGLIVKRLW